MTQRMNPCELFADDQWDVVNNRPLTRTATEDGDTAEKSTLPVTTDVVMSDDQASHRPQAA
jgi:hypothetical protein